jgi:carbon starvation protein CstA
MAVGHDRTMPSQSTLPPSVRNRLPGLMALGLGAILLLVSLFLDWFEPGNSAWTIFEVSDIVLAALALAVLAAVAAEFGVWSQRPDSWLLVPAIVAPIIVIVSLINQPPAAQAPGQEPMAGIWLALAGSLLMLIGAVLAVARISVAVNRADPAAPRGPAPGHGPSPGAGTPPPGAPVGTERPTTPTRRAVP